MPRLWRDTIDAHRHDVRHAIFATTATLVEEVGVAGLTMSRIAHDSGIGRATLYKYFDSVGAILDAWHEEHVARILQHLGGVRDLRAVLMAYARMRRRHDIGAMHHSHRDDAEQQLTAFLTELLAEGLASGEVRGDVPARLLAIFCVHALAGAGSLRSQAEVERLVEVTMAAVRPPPSPPPRQDQD